MGQSPGAAYASKITHVAVFDTAKGFLYHSLGRVGAAADEIPSNMTSNGIGLGRHELYWIANVHSIRSCKK